MIVSKFFRALSFTSFLLLLLFLVIPVYKLSLADELEEITKQIADLQSRFSQMEVAKAGVGKTLKGNTHIARAGMNPFRPTKDWEMTKEFFNPNN